MKKAIGKAYILIGVDGETVAVDLGEITAISIEPVDRPAAPEDEKR